MTVVKMGHPNRVEPECPSWIAAVVSRTAGNLKPFSLSIPDDIICTTAAKQRDQDQGTSNK